jgi:hypothetical protein
LSLAVGLAQLQAEGHVLAHRHVRVQRVALEDHRDVAVLRLQVVDHLAVDHDLAAGDLFQSGQHAQQRALAAARGADQHDELAIGDVEADAVDNLDLAVGLLDVAEADRCHLASPPKRLRRSPPGGRRQRPGKASSAALLERLAGPVSAKNR